MSEIEWEEPPPHAMRVGQRSRYAELITALREHPGRWAKLPGEKSSLDSAKGTALNIRSGKMRGFTKGEFETAVDNTTVYVRYVAPADGAAPAKEEGTDPADAPEPSELNGFRSQDVRAWGRVNGYTLGERGALPRDLVTAYAAAHAVNPTHRVIQESDL